MGDTWEEQTKPSPHDGKQSSNCLLSELQWIKETSSNALKPNKSFHKLSDEWQVSQESWYRRMPILKITGAVTSQEVSQLLVSFTAGYVSFEANL